MEEIDRFAQTIRHDLVAYGFDQRPELLDAFRRKVEERLGSMKA
jgi:hypothetical protein